MSGGIAYIYDPDNKFPARCNMGLVGLETIDTDEEKQEVYGYIEGARRAYRFHTRTRDA
jgi:glutamate synthase domain-containing protein 3